MLTLLIKEVMKKYADQFRYLGVNQKATITPIWVIRMFDMEFHVGLFVARFK